MKVKLLKRDPHLITGTHIHKDSSLFWIYDDNQYIGLHKTQFSEQEQTFLLEWFPLPTDSFPLTPSTQSWKNFLEGDSSTFPVDEFTAYRVTHYRSSSNNSSKETVLDMIQSLLPENTVLIPQTISYGWIVEYGDSPFLGEEEWQAWSQAMEGDFYQRVSFFIGDPLLVKEHADLHIQLDEKLFDVGVSLQQNSVIYNRASVLPYYLMANYPVKERNALFERILHLFLEEPEMVKTIKTYITCQQNTSQTAKALYMHRNSLQYRLDKFTEKTNVDLKSFEGALLTYLACVHMEVGKTD